MIEVKRKQAAEVSATRLLTDEDFLAIEASLVRKQIEPAKKGIKRKLEEEVKTK